MEQFVTICEPCHEYVVYASDNGFDDDDHYSDAHDGLKQLQEGMSFKLDTAYPDINDAGHSVNCEVCEHSIRNNDHCYRVEVTSNGAEQTT